MGNQLFDKASNNTQLVNLDRRLLINLAGLWKLSPIICPLDVHEVDEVEKRSSFDNNFLHCPKSYSGFRSNQIGDLFKAVITHIGAHMEFSLEKLNAKSLKPIQIALISILEDTRVELLAGRQYPGLLKLWRSFHVVQSTGPLLANSLLERLARALIDPTYIDNNSWIVKARKLIPTCVCDWGDSEELRRIGVILGNDLGQMRVQFNSKNYVVQPAYRDDNLGIWNFPDLLSDDFEEKNIVEISARLEKNKNTQDDNLRPDKDSSSEHSMQVAFQEVDSKIGIPISRQHEWDYLQRCHKQDWVTIMQYELRTAPASIIDNIFSKNTEIQRKLNKLVENAKIGRPVRLKRQHEGDRLDIDACISTQIDKKAGIQTEGRIYEHTLQRYRDLSVLVLLDISESTKELLNGTAKSVFSVERSAVALLAHAMDKAEDLFAVHAFCSNGRNDLRYHEIKNFQSPYNDECKANLAGLRPGYSTRLGAALRHAGAQIIHQNTHRKLILVVTDGEPSDVDIDDEKYLIEDSRKAVHELSGQGIDVFGVGLNDGADTYLPYIFGRKNSLQLDSIEKLPEKLPMLYFRIVS